MGHFSCLCHWWWPSAGWPCCPTCDHNTRTRSLWERASRHWACGQLPGKHGSPSDTCVSNVASRHWTHQGATVPREKRHWHTCPYQTPAATPSCTSWHELAAEIHSYHHCTPRQEEGTGAPNRWAGGSHSSALSSLTTAIRIYSGRPEHPPLPDFIEVARPATAASIQQELTYWGHTCEVDLLEELDIAFAYIINGELQKMCKIFLSITNGQIIGPYYYLEPPQLENETIDMKFLHSKSHPKAVITSYRASLHSTVIANFEESFGTLEEHIAKPRQPPDWPAPQPVAPACHMYPQSTLEVAHTDRDSRVKIGKTTEELCGLHTNFEDLQLPVELHLFLNSIPLLGDVHPDRYIIYVDGSSQGQQQHHPIAWIEEHGIPDAWAMIVLAERYATPDQTHQLFLVGWTAQQVRYDSASRFYIGSTIPGSLTAEREGMTWAFLWRIGQNNMVPTLFRSDSQLTCDQASGSKGATFLDDSFLCLRGAYQLLDTALPRGHLELEHIYGHCGEPFNDFTDLMAKQEALSSFYLPRLKIDMTSWRTKLPHLWLLFAQHLGGPQHYDGYFHTPVPNLPNPVTASPSMNPTRTHGMIHIKIQLSLCTANVLSMYNRPEGYAGKVGFLVEQFQAHCLLFGGIQEARTPEGSCRCQNILRLCSGASQGQGGVELWINLTQPYGYEGRIPLLLKQEHVQVLHADPQRLLARVVAPHLDIFVLVGHAPHSGHPQATRSTWWTSTTDLLHDLCGENKPYVMIDANAEPGPADGRSVLNTTCTTSKSTPLWRQFLAEHQLALPQTLPLHVGGLATWISPEGSTTHCLDYVAVPVERLPCCTSSQLLESLDLGNEQQDHTPVAIELEWDFHAPCPNPPERQLKDNFDRTIIRTTKMDGFLENFPTMDWATDVDTQVQTFNRAVHGDLHRLCPTKRRGPKKSFINRGDLAIESQQIDLQESPQTHQKDHFERAPGHLFSGLAILQIWPAPVLLCTTPTVYDNIAMWDPSTLCWIQEVRQTAQEWPEVGSTPGCCWPCGQTAADSIGINHSPYLEATCWHQQSQEQGHCSTSTSPGPWRQTMCISGSSLRPLDWVLWQHGRWNKSPSPTTKRQLDPKSQASELWEGWDRTWGTSFIDCPWISL